MTHQNPHQFKIQSGIVAQTHGDERGAHEHAAQAEGFYDEAEWMHWYAGGYSVRKDVDAGEA